ncbi:GGDEF domain-containing protein [Glycocaulis sp.]|uniref:GGDEF domain-containing protein n=1 Tax=Glycocaulis sp. TaxID=1969725 RepID=UPI0025C5AE97|nr:GGDEF domain-containing protein [Glycocaulis sp.]MCH8522060.1 GGDEF domain-containing protein [Glycocaulis sp.]
MRIQPGGPLGATSSVSGPSRTERTRQTGASGAAARTGDTASIMGVPEAELTPNVQRALLTLMGEVDQLRRETEALRAKVRDLEELADRDVLLPVLNRRAFLREVSKALSLAERHDAPSALVYLDLNGFKAINDTHGHAAGDAALQAVADVLVSHVRDTDAVGRLGGDEFGVVLVLTAPEQAERKAEELAAAIAATVIRHEGLELSLKAAWGVHGLTSGISAESAMAEADAAMYARKQAAA